MRQFSVLITLVLFIHAAFGSLLYTNKRSSANKLIPELMNDLHRLIARETQAGRPAEGLQQHLGALQHLQTSMLAPTSCMEKGNYKYVQSHFKSAKKMLRRGGDIEPLMRSAWENYFTNLQQCPANGPETDSCCAGCCTATGDCCFPRHYYGPYPYGPHYQPSCCFIYVGDGPDCGDWGCCDGISDCVGGACTATGECIGGSCEAVGNGVGEGCGLIGSCLVGVGEALGACASCLGSCNC